MADSSNIGVPDSLLETVEKDQLKWLYDNDPVMHFSVNAKTCLLYTSPSPRDQRGSRMPSSA